MKQFGMQVWVDVVGNLIGCFEGFDFDCFVLVIGFYFDMVFIGGCFDGVLGVLVGLEVCCVF